MARIGWITGVISLVLAGSVLAQTATLNPDISIGGNFKGTWLSKDNHELGGFGIDEIELSYQGYFHPQMRSDVFLSLSKGDSGDYGVSVEEAYITGRTDTSGLGYKLGKKKLNFGKVHPLHPEQIRYASKPTVIQNFLGPDDVAPEGLSVDYILPLPWFAQVDVGYWKRSEVVPTSSFSLTGPMASAHLKSSFELGEDSELELGASIASGKGPLLNLNKDDVTILGLDSTWKIVTSGGNKWMWQTEALLLNRNLADETFTRSGAYSYLGYQWTKTWETGLRLDISQSADQINLTTRSLTVVATNQLNETSRIRFEYGLNTDTNVSQITCQLQFILGPHSHLLQ